MTMRFVLKVFLFFSCCKVKSINGYAGLHRKTLFEVKLETGFCLLCNNLMIKISGMLFILLIEVWF